MEAGAVYISEDLVCEHLHLRYKDKKAPMFQRMVTSQSPKLYEIPLPFY